MLAPRTFGSVRINWREREARTEAEKQLVWKMKEAAHVLARIMRANIGTPGPPHSSPGSYPHKITGRLQSSIRVRVVGMDVQIVASTPYTKYVEKIRPFMRRSLNENREHLKRVIRSRRSLSDIMRG